MGEEQQFCLRWNNFQANITSQFESLRDEEDFVDVTLACEGQQLKAHKVVLSACSPYFKELFKSNPCKHPIIFMRDVEFKHLQCLLEFMYAGEVNVAQAQLPAFLRTAESLQIRGLTEAPRQKSESKQQPPPPSPLQTPSHGSPVQAHSTPKPPPRQTRSAISPPTLVPRPSLCLEGKQNSTANSHIDEGITPPAKRIKSDSECEAGLIISGSQDDMEHSRSSMPAERLDVEGKSDSPEVIQPKLELPEYNSDGESRADSMGGSTSLLGLDNSMDMHSSFAALQSGVDVIPGTSSQPSVGDLSLDSSQVDQRKLHSLDPRPCPICNRMYSNLSNLRQHVRLIHNPQNVVCPLCNKPFKTKLYLKRHLMSFHELTSKTPGTQMAPADLLASAYLSSPSLLKASNGESDSTETEENS